MDRIKHTRPSPAVIIAVLALFVALGSVAVAGKKKEAPRNSVVSKSIKKGEVKSSDIKNKKGVKSKDVKNDTLTGDDIDESQLGSVPSAANAESVDSIVPLGDSVTTVSTGGSATLITYGPFKVVGECNVDGADLEADVLIETTEANSDYAGDDNSDGDLDPGDPRSERIFENPGASSDVVPTTSDGYDDQFYARAPSGKALAGTVNSFAHESAGICKFSGFIAITG